MRMCGKREPRGVLVSLALLFQNLNVDRDRDREVEQGVESDPEDRGLESWSLGLFQ